MQVCMSLLPPSRHLLSTEASDEPSAFLCEKPLAFQRFADFPYAAENPCSNVHDCILQLVPSQDQAPIPTSGWELCDLTDPLYGDPFFPLSLFRKEESQTKKT